MSIRRALDFIQEVERHPAIKDAVRRAFADHGFAGVIKIGADRHFDFDESHLRRAFAIDWSMRVLHTARSLLL